MLVSVGVVCCGVVVCGVWVVGVGYGDGFVYVCVLYWEQSVDIVYVWVCGGGVCVCGGVVFVLWVDVWIWVCGCVGIYGSVMCIRITWEYGDV